MGDHLGEPAPRPVAGSAPGVRVVLDVRPLQDRDRSPTTAIYLEELLGAFDRAPLSGESFVLVLQTGLPDPVTARFPTLDVAARRRLPPTRLLRAGALTVDPFLLRGAAIGTDWRAGRSGASGAVFHTASGAVPMASGLPLVVSLLDLAPWELSHAYQRTPTAAFGQRVRGRIVRRAAAVIVGSAAGRLAAHRLLHVPLDRLHVIPLAAREAFQPRRAADVAGRASPPAVDVRSDRERLGVPDRYLVYSGRYDARQDLRTLLRALSRLAATARPSAVAEGAWPPRVLLVDTSPGDRAALARAAAREGVGELLAYAPNLPPERLAGLVGEARAAILPALSEATGLPAIEALAMRTPVIATAVGALPEIVGGAGILVERADPERLARAIATLWTDDPLREQMRAEAGARSSAGRRTWADVARETRIVYASAARGRSGTA